jgi:RHS repeat-associated protein
MDLGRADMRWMDVTDGLYYDQARWYDPAAGRFVSEDPAPSAPQDRSNLYRYVANDPLDQTDPTGTSASAHSFFGAGSDYSLGDSKGTHIDSLFTHLWKSPNRRASPLNPPASPLNPHGRAETAECHCPERPRASSNHLVLQAEGP